MSIRPFAAMIGLFSLAIGGCGRGTPVVVYSALDEEFARPVLEAYSERAGVEVLPKFDVESTKTVGLTNLIMVEASRPRCDVFWNNEILNTIRLARKGLLAPSKPTHAGEVPDTFKAKDGTWYGFAARARVLLVNTDLLPEGGRPKGLRDLVDSKWKGRAGIAKPLFGTTATHAACLFAAWGDEKAMGFFRDLKANGVKVYGGNKGVAQAVGSGAIAFGLTDTDDAMGEILEGRPVAIVYPDRNPSELGTLFIPNVLAVLKGAPHPAQAGALVDHLLSPEVEATLAGGPSVQIPLLTSSKATTKVETPRTVHAMPADFEAAAMAWDRVTRFLEAEFSGN